MALKRLTASSLLICCLYGYIVCTTIEDVKNLKASLFANNTYDNTVRPIYNQSNAISVEAHLRLFAIHQLNEVTESLKTTAALVFTWQDESLIWDRYSNGGVDAIHIPQNRIWKPNLALQNTLTQYQQLGHESLSVYVFSDGMVQWSPLEIFVSTCLLDISYFPNDVQRCALEFVTWSYSSHEIEFVAMDVDDFPKNSLWEIVSVDADILPESGNAGITFKLVLKRKTTYDMITLVFPVIMLYIINVAVFLLPSDGGEKSGFAVTVILAFTVYLTILESSFPKNAETTSYFAIFVIAGTVQSVTIAIVALAMIRCASFTESSNVPSCLATYVRFVKCQAKRTKIEKNKTSPIESTEDGNSGTEVVTLSTHSVGESESNPSPTWKECMDVLDGVFLCIFLTTFLASAIFYFVQIL